MNLFQPRKSPNSDRSKADTCVGSQPQSIEPEQAKRNSDASPTSCRQSASLENASKPLRRMTMLCLNPIKVNNRRHSSEIKNILPIISISRAKSDNNLNSINCNVNNLSRHGHHHHGFGTNHYDKILQDTSIDVLSSTVRLKEHNYQRLTNLKSNKCRVCSESIFFNCFECTQCKLVGHKKCLQNLYVKCPNKAMPPRLTMFGLDIDSAADHQVSEVLSVCIREIERRPFSKLKALYKTDGDLGVIRNLCLSFEFGPHLIDLSTVHVHNIVGVIKEFLSELSTPIFNRQIQAELIVIGKEWPPRKGLSAFFVPYTPSGLAILIFEFRRLISYLTPCYRNNLMYLLYHWKRVADQPKIDISANTISRIFYNIIFSDLRYQTDCNGVTFECNQDSSGDYNVDNDYIKNDIHDDGNDDCHCHHEDEGGNDHDFGHRSKSKISTTEHRVASDRFVFDVPFKIRALELMINHAHDIF